MGDISLPVGAAMAEATSARVVVRRVVKCILMVDLMNLWVGLLDRLFGGV